MQITPASRRGFLLPDSGLSPGGERLYILAMKRALCLALTGFSLFLAGSAAHSQPVPQSVPRITVPQSRAEISLSFAPIVKRVAPAVVNVYAQRKVRQARNPLFDDPFFRQF